MKKTVIAAAVLAATAGAVQAQNVTIYGRLDAGIEYISDSGAGADSLVRMNNGGILPSIWGFRGSEDLGGGLKAVFNLEGDFDSGTGGQRPLGSIATGIFGRQANVGLSGGFGTILLGRQYSPALLADLGTEPRGFKESYSSLLTYAATQAPTGNGIAGNNAAGIFTSNLISYSTSFGPVNVGIGYGLGEVAGETSDGTTVSLGVSYAGPVTVSGSYQQIKGVGNDAETKRYSLGVAVPLGAFTLKGYYANATEDAAVGGAEIADTDNFGVGVNWAWNPQNTFTAAYYYGKDDGTAAGVTDKTKVLVLSNDYALSKRTTLYVQAVFVDSDQVGAPAGGLGLTRTDVTLGTITGGEKGQIFGIGLMHSF